MDEPNTLGVRVPDFSGIFSQYAGTEIKIEKISRSSVLPRGVTVLSNKLVLSEEASRSPVICAFKQAAKEAGVKFNIVLSRKEVICVDESTGISNVELNLFLGRKGDTYVVRDYALRLV